MKTTEQSSKAPVGGILSLGFLALAIATVPILPRLGGEPVEPAMGAIAQAIAVVFYASAFCFCGLIAGVAGLLRRETPLWLAGLGAFLSLAPAIVFLRMAPEIFGPKL
jgi:hypothetical protein